MIVLHHPYITNLADVIVVIFIVKHRSEPLELVVLWNPSIRKSVRIGIHKLPRKNGDAIIETIEDDDHLVLQVYDPYLGRISGLVCNVWMMKDDHVIKSFTKMLSIKSSDRLFKDVLEFKKNGDAIIETIENDDHFVLQVYDPFLGHISGDLGMEGSYFSFSIRSYKEMLLLLDE
uniref:Uncharacterized protein n=1 Tax=Tanacetum cinerariifolium TaxID=118510 RepID=A0A699H8Y0_TANCI|nr:hypothetical protein [Tanacetum cinerariifolium]